MCQQVQKYVFLGFTNFQAILASVTVQDLVGIDSHCSMLKGWSVKRPEVTHSLEKD